MSELTLTLIRTLQREGQAPVIDLINALRAAGLPAVVVSARRTHARQTQLISAGLTTATRSRHLEGRAWDLGFRGVRSRAVPSYWWRAAGESWERMGGRWGGRFRPAADPLHFDW